MLVRAGVIGVGAMGRHHARIYDELPNVELVGVADVDETRRVEHADRRWPWFSSPEELLALEPDVVSIAVPTSLHRDVAVAAIAAGCDVLVEKPLASTSREARTLAAAAAARGCVLAVGHVERFNPAIRALKHEAEAGNLGRVSSVVARRVGVMPPRVKDANIVIDLAVHDIDICAWLFTGAPDEVHATGGAALLSERLDYVDVFMERGELGCFLQANWITPVKIRTLAVTGDAGYAEVNYVTQELSLYRTMRDVDPGTYDDFLSLGTSAPVSLAVDRREPLRVEIENFVAYVRDRSAGEIVTAEEAITTLDIAERALAEISA